MRLLNVESLELQDFIGILPPYTILSHTWGAEEVTYQDLRNGGLTRLIGFRKLHAVCEQTRRDGFQFTWIDTCCIDKSSSSELNEAINSMYQWYSKASVCYVYMEDVRYADGEELGPTSEFCRSRWFTRGWTLQELIAPSSVTFFDTSWCLIGTKTSLLSVLSVVTGIPQSCLSGEKLLADFSVATRLSWASKRMCTREEDRAYSLMGLFDVYMPLIYGEGENAFLRLQEEIISHTSDQSILAWSVREGDSRCWMPTSVFARSIADFANATGIQPFTGPELHPSVLTNLGLSISLQLVTTSISPVPSFLKGFNLGDSAELQAAYLDCGPDAQHTVQIFLASPYTFPVWSESAAFFRIATPLIITERRRNLEYKSLYIKLRPNNFLRSEQTVPYHEIQKLASSSSRGYTNPASFFKNMRVADPSFMIATGRDMLNMAVDVLNEKMVPNATGRLFLPEGAIDKVLNEDIMLRLLRDLSQSPSSTTGTIEYTPILPRCRKIFAILILSGLLRFFQILVNKLGVSDECLPMPDLESLPSPILIGTQNVEHLKKWTFVAEVFERKVYTRMFFERQWCVLAPVFRSRDHIQHISLSQHHILPFVRDAPDTLDKGAGHAANNSLRAGGFGEIHKVCIHPDHHDFGTELGTHFSDNSIYTRSNTFAIKQLRGTDRKGFEIEKHTLQRFQNSHSLHILQLLATYEVRANYLDYTPITYNMLFPWADCNLRELWQSDRHRRNAGIVLWIAEQCWKLADALKVVHTGYMDFESDAHEPERFYGIHGDIKPANILYFTAASTGDLEELGRLVIGDFGLTHFHRENTRSKISSSSVGFSVTYSAPEYMVEKKISQKVDIWALGCVFLEFITWFLMGPESVNRKFRDLRVDADTTLAIQSDKFFQAISYDDGRPPLARVKPVVLEWIHILYKTDGCSGYFNDFLYLIRYQMLTVNPHSRIQADELSQKLEQMYHKCLYKPQYYHTDSNPRRSAAESGPISWLLEHWR